MNGTHFKVGILCHLQSNYLHSIASLSLVHL